MKCVYLLVFFSLVLGQEEPPCPLTSYLEEDHAAYVYEAEELGWYTDGRPDAEAVRTHDLTICCRCPHVCIQIVADVGQEVFDACHLLAESVNADNVKEATCDFYDCACAGDGAGGWTGWMLGRRRGGSARTVGHGQRCLPNLLSFQVVQMSKEVYLFDCLGLNGAEEEAPCE